ncbi:hypothetical protein KR018_004990, partial [Drosophila ironensis]
VAFMKEYIDLGHMSLSSRHTPMPQYFLPHHCVHKLDSTTTKLRVVFDGSAKSTSGYSLNDLLFTGPSIQPKIFSTLLRFRSFRVALCALLILFIIFRLLSVKLVRRYFYVDDLISGGDSVEEVVQIRQQVKGLFGRGHFPIRKWCSNEAAALEGEPEADREKT